MCTFLKCVLLVVYNNVVLKTRLNNFHVSIYPWLGGVYQAGGGALKMFLSSLYFRN
jgi:hypothetical protein